MIQTALQQILKNAQGRFADWLQRYEAWHGENGITERNLSFQFATAFLHLNPEGLAFMEVPFAASPGDAVRNHLDAYFHTTEFDLLLECKVVATEGDIKAIANDINRIMDPYLQEQICLRHYHRKPKTTYGIILAETWLPKVVDWWNGGTSLNWSRGNLQPDWQYGSLKVLQVKDEVNWTLHWLYAVSPQL